MSDMKLFNITLKDKFMPGIASRSVQLLCVEDVYDGLNKNEQYQCDKFTSQQLIHNGLLICYLKA